MYNLFEASTIHSFCEKIMRKYGVLKSIRNDFQISSSTDDNTLIISKILSSYRNTPLICRSKIGIRIIIFKNDFLNWLSEFSN